MAWLVAACAGARIDAHCRRSCHVENETRAKLWPPIIVAAGRYGVSVSAALRSVARKIVMAAINIKIALFGEAMARMAMAAPSLGQSNDWLSSPSMLFGRSHLVSKRCHRACRVIK